MQRIILLVFLFLVSSALKAAPLKLLDSYPTFAGASVALKDIVGTKPVYLKFWASWCLDCRHELPSLEKSYQQYHNDIAMFAVNLNINESDDAIRELQQKSGLTMPIVMDQNGSIASNFQFVGTPFHVLINAKGEVVYSTYRDDAKLAYKLQQLAADKIDSVDPETITHLAKAPQPSKPVASNNDIVLVYFSAVWCDSYMADVDANIASHCINAIHTVDKLYQAHPKMVLQAYVTHLWTEDKDLLDYQQRLHIPYPVKIDHNNAVFQQYHGTGYPTVIVLKQGKEVARFTDFTDSEKVLTALKEYF